MEGVLAVADAIKKHPDAKCIVSLMSFTLDMMGPGVEPPEAIQAHFSKGGKAVLLGGPGMGAMDPGREDPLLTYVADGLLVLIANRPYLEPEPKGARDPADLTPKEYFEKYMMVVTRDTLADYKKQMKKSMSPPTKKR